MTQATLHFIFIDLLPLYITAIVTAIGWVVAAHLGYKFLKLSSNENRVQNYKEKAYFSMNEKLEELAQYVEEYRNLITKLNLKIDMSEYGLGTIAIADLEAFSVVNVKINLSLKEFEKVFEGYEIFFKPQEKGLAVLTEAYLKSTDSIDTFQQKLFSFVTAQDIRFKALEKISVTDSVPQADKDLVDLKDEIKILRRSLQKEVFGKILKK